MAQCNWCKKSVTRKTKDVFGDCNRLDCRQSRARAVHTFVPDPNRNYFEQRDEEYAKVNKRIANTLFIPIDS